VGICPKFEDDNLSEFFSAETEFRRNRCLVVPLEMSLSLLSGTMAHAPTKSSLPFKTRHVHGNSSASGGMRQRLVSYLGRIILYLDMTFLRGKTFR
jgi:hypothetical protein